MRRGGGAARLGPLVGRRRLPDKVVEAGEDEAAPEDGLSHAHRPLAALAVANARAAAERVARLGGRLGLASALRAAGRALRRAARRLVVRPYHRGQQVQRALAALGRHRLRVQQQLQRRQRAQRKRRRVVERRRGRRRRARRRSDRLRRLARVAEAALVGDGEQRRIARGEGSAEHGRLARAQQAQRHLAHGREGRDAGSLGRRLARRLGLGIGLGEGCVRQEQQLRLLAEERREGGGLELDGARRLARLNRPVALLRNRREEGAQEGARRRGA